jgi:hypothetical protein
MASAPTSGISLTIRLSASARAKLAERAAKSGQDISAIASELIEQAVTHPPLDEIMAPVRKQVADSGISDGDLDELLGNELKAVRAQRKAKPA